MSVSSLPARTGYSSIQVALHWIIAILLTANAFITGEDMGQAWRAYEKGDTSQVSLLVPQLHIWFGIAILVFALWRLTLRQTRGVPDLPAEESAVMRFLANATHVLLYLLMLAIPLTGIAVYYFGVDVAGDIHEFLRLPLIVLVALHILGGLHQHFILKTNVLTRMLRPEA